MVRRSNAISREICRVKGVDDVSLRIRNEGRCVNNGPGPRRSIARRRGTNMAISVTSVEAARQKSELS